VSALRAALPTFASSVVTAVPGGSTMRFRRKERGQIPVWVEGVLKFRFNTAGDRGCAWYSKYGLQSSSYGNPSAE